MTFFIFRVWCSAPQQWICVTFIYMVPAVLITIQMLSPRSHAGPAIQVGKAPPTPVANSDTEYAPRDPTPAARVEQVSQIVDSLWRIS
jgi:hypothetical protein